MVANRRTHFESPLSRAERFNTESLPLIVAPPPPATLTELGFHVPVRHLDDDLAFHSTCTVSLIRLTYDSCHDRALYPMTSAGLGSLPWRQSIRIFS